MSFDPDQALPGGRSGRLGVRAPRGIANGGRSPAALETLPDPLLQHPEDSLGEDTGAAERRRWATMRRRDAVFRRMLALADAITVAIVLYAATSIFGDDSLTFPIVAAFVLVILLMKVAGLYDRDAQLLHKTTLDEIPALFQIATLSALLLWLAGDVLLTSGDYGRRQIFGMWSLLFILLIVGRSLARHLAGRLTPPVRCLFLGDAASAAALGAKFRIDTTVHAELVGRLPLEPGPATSDAPPLPELPSELAEVMARKQIHRVILAPGHVDRDELLHLVRRVRALDVAVSVLPATPPVAGSVVEMDHINGLTLLGIHSFQMGRSSKLLKRAFDLVATSLLLLLLSPLLLAIAVAIRLDSAGPVLFRQRRIGRDGASFEMLKFRSMRDGAERERAGLLELNEADGLFKLDHDPRTTRVGRIIRRWSLDELPQLVNVLRGEMSLVGPRPLVPEEDSMIVGHYRRRLDLAPGITGYWQALGSYRIPLSEMVRLDYLYVETWSLWNDIRILLRTIPYVAGRRGR
jgi:exopolysaccharide biosynthesis polyprenyl glycosylphosphotransferase